MQSRGNGTDAVQKKEDAPKKMKEETTVNVSRIGRFKYLWLIPSFKPDQKPSTFLLPVIIQKSSNFPKRWATLTKIFESG